MEAKRLEATRSDVRTRIDWESFYANYRKPGYVPGFEIVNKLGGGVFGMVFKARKESIGKDYAIKFLKVDDEVVRDAVVRELTTVRFFAQIDHPNLVSIEDKGEVDGIPFIIMSYAGEETLRKRLAGGPLSREDALRIFIQVARGVQALHERSLVHFDLKPANVFLRGEIARVGDYGLSKLITESRNSLSFGRGTPYYMAPEMLQRRGDARSDVYSLGVLLYECLTGDVPFKGDSEWEVLRKHESELPRYPSEIAETDRRLIDRCLAKNPDDRFQNGAELLRALHAPAALGESLVIPAPVGGMRSAPDGNGASWWPHGASEQPAVEARDPRHSPYGMPWQRAAPVASGLVGNAVHFAFRLVELAIMLVLVPVRAVSLGMGNGIVMLLQAPFRIIRVALRAVGFILQLPFRVLAVLLQIVGYVLMAAAVMAITIGFAYLFQLLV
jgi:tRNA A-37 threonylcarbamoyl transferase component Bud32